MRLELVSIETDTHPLDGLYYEPEGGPRHGAVLVMHGNCMSFYTGPSRFLAAPLVAAGYAVLAYNRRGHDVVHTHGRDASGGAFQLVQEMIDDNAAAAGWLAARGHKDPVVIGHSNGGMLAVRHVAERPSTPAMVLLSAHRGGRRIVPMMSAAGLWAGDELDSLTARAERLVAAGEPRALLTMPGWWYVISARTVLDFQRNLPDILDLAPEIGCPTLFVRGDQEARDVYPAEDFAARTSGRCDVEIAAACDHFYSGREAEVSRMVVGWLEARRQETVRAGRRVL